jgi:hypothetical protein
MISNLHLAAVVAKGAERSLFRLPLAKSVQQALGVEWSRQHEALLAGNDIVDFDSAYNPEENEILRISGFKPPAWLAKQNSREAVHLAVMGQAPSDLERIRGLLGFGQLGGEEVVLFQSFSRSHVLRPGFSLFSENGSYRSIEQPGVTLSDRLAGVLRSNGELLFPAFRSINAIMPMLEYYREASENEIREVLRHKHIVAEDADALARAPSQWFSKRFAFLRDSEVLKKYAPKQLRARAKKCNLAVKLKDGKIVFPANKADAKRLLQFLNEELFRGAITEKLYSTNSKRAEPGALSSGG